MCACARPSASRAAFGAIACARWVARVRIARRCYAARQRIANRIGARRSANADDVAFAALVRALRRRADAASSQCALMPARPRRRRAGLGGAPEIADGGADGHSEAAGSAGWGSDGGESDDSEFERVELKPG